jgi:predicted AAA+ superfamily ATPase
VGDTKLKNSNVTGLETTLFDTIANNYSADDIYNIIKKQQLFRPLLIESLNEQIIWGGFPELLAMNDETKRNRYLSNYLQTYLEKDIRDIASVTDLKLYQNLIQIIAEQTGSVRDDKKIIQALGCSRNTLKKYQGYLTATLLVNEVYPFINSSLKRLVKSPKIYLINNGILNFLTNINKIEILEKTGLVGHRLENWFLKELQMM